MNNEKTIELQRTLLGSLNLKQSDLEDNLTEEERRNYCAAIFAVYPRLERDIKMFLYEQLMFSSLNADTWEKVIFGRGTFNGMDILLNHWKKACDSHLESLKSKENFDIHNPVSEI